MTTVSHTTAAPGSAVIIVTYHTGPCLMDCIRAVLGEASAREVVVVDNGNPPEVVARLEEMAASEPRLTLLTGHGNVGFGKACNLGAQATTSPHLLLLNPDSVLQPGSLDGAMTLRATSPHAASVVECASLIARISGPRPFLTTPCHWNA